MNNLAWGRGSLVVDGGVISVLVILGMAIGAMVAIEAWATLNMMGFGALSGIVGSLANVREMAPLVAGIAFAAQNRVPHDGRDRLDADRRGNRRHRGHGFTADTVCGGNPSRRRIAVRGSRLRADVADKLLYFNWMIR